MNKITRIQPLVWQPPPTEFAKINVGVVGSNDGSFGAVAAVGRDLGGNFLCAPAIILRFI